jgi:hypothetical protein
MVEADSHLKLFIAYIWNIYKVFQHILSMLSIGIRYQPYTNTGKPILHCSNFGVLGHLWSQNDVITSGWGWQPPQTIYCIHIKHIQSVWAHWYAVHWCTVKALHSYNHTTWLRFWCTGSLVESKWCHYVMAEADSQLKLFIAYIWDIYKVFSTLICCPLMYG